MEITIREKILDIALSEWTLNIGSGILFYGLLAGGIFGGCGGLIGAMLGGLGGAFYSTFK